MWTGQLEEAERRATGSFAVALGDGEGSTAVFGMFDDEETRTSVLGIEETLVLVSLGLCQSPACLHSSRRLSPNLRRSNETHSSITAQQRQRTKQHTLNCAAPGLRPFAVSVFLPVFLLSQHGWGMTSTCERTPTALTLTAGTVLSSTTLSFNCSTKSL